MQPSVRFFAGDEELAKRDDDHRPGRWDQSQSSSRWSVMGGFFRFRRKRLVVLILGVLLFYTLFHQLRRNMIIGGITYGSPMSGKQTPMGWGNVPAEGEAPAVDSTRAEGSSKHYYNGVAKLYKLAGSLQALVRMRGSMEDNRNVLFAAANLKSAAALIPMACEMARWRRSNVHFAFMGRDDLPIADIQEINGVNSDCEVTWHDARPDYSPYSTDVRLEISVQGAMFHINDFMHPQVVIIDGSGIEDRIFRSALVGKMRSMSKPLIELPKDGPERLRWMTRLDSGSLAAWHRAQIEIVIQAVPGSSGSLIKLLRSLAEADYFGSIPPRLTIELPAIIDTPTKRYLEDFHWPPLSSMQDGSPSIELLTLRHVISSLDSSSERDSLRIVESFYPKNPAYSHLLLLSPHVELSPLYYHYLKFNLLNYLYSSWSFLSVNDLVGISLALPSVHLNGSTPLTLPSPAINSPFLWQAPNTNAALYFGSFWVEFHDFLTRRLAIPLPSPPPAFPLARTEPEWSSHLLSLLRVRDWYLLYPPFSASSGNTTDSKSNPIIPGVAVVHTDLSHPSHAYLSRSDQGTESRLLSNTAALHYHLPFEADLPDLGYLPQLTPDGQTAATRNSRHEWAGQLEETRSSYAAAFRKEVGGCRAQEGKDRIGMSAADLFCDDNDNDNDRPDERRPLDVSSPEVGHTDSPSTTLTLNSTAPAGDRVWPTFTPT